MTVEQGDKKDLSKEQKIFDLSKREYLYRMVFYTEISPRQLDDDLILEIDKPSPTTQEGKRELKLIEIDAYKNACLQAYNELCDLGVARFDINFLMENGFGMGAGDLLDDQDLDKLIVKDEEIDQAKLKGRVAE